MKPTTELPDDPALPAVAAIRALGLCAVIPALGLDPVSVEVVLCGYSPRERATLEVRAGGRHFAVKAYARDPAPEAELYQALAAVGLGGDSGARVPPLLLWDRDLRVLAIGWLEGPTAEDLIKQGQGARAGELAASWLQRVGSVPVKLGSLLNAARMLHRTHTWVAGLGDADGALGAAATALVERLTQTQPQAEAARLVHGTFYDRHVLDVGDGPGVIDWERFGQGPPELDAGMFLATTARLGLRHEGLAGEVARVEEAFLAGAHGLVDEYALAWHRAVALLRLAHKPVSTSGAGRLATRGKDVGQGLARAQALLTEAARLAEAAAPRRAAPARPARVRIALLLQRYVSRRGHLPDVVALLAEHGADVVVMHPQEHPVDLSMVRVEHDLYVLHETSDVALGLAGALQAAGAVILNSYPASIMLRDEILTARVLRGAGVPTPEAYVAARALELEPLLAAGPLVVKPYRGSRGHMRVVRTPADLREVHAGREPVFARRYVASEGRRRRVYAIGADLFSVPHASAATTPPEPDTVPPAGELADVMQRCRRAFGIDLFGVDVIESQGQPCVVGASSVPAFAGVRDAPRLLAQYIYGAAQRAARGDATVLVEPPAAVASVAQRLFGATTLRFVLNALSTTPATPQELDQIQKLLDEKRERRP